MRQYYSKLVVREAIHLCVRGKLVIIHLKTVVVFRSRFFPRASWAPVKLGMAPPLSAIAEDDPEDIIHIDGNTPDDNKESHHKSTLQYEE